MAKALAVFCLALCLYVTPYLWSPFASRGQAREAVVVMNMLEQHNFVLPLRNGADIPSKPPLFHWTTLPFVFANGGLNEFAMRIPSAIFGAAGVAVAFYAAQPILGAVGAGLTAAVLATSLEWLRSANLARVDMVFAVAILLAWLAYLAAVERRLLKQPGYAGFLILMGVATGLAVLAKGPTALLLVAAFAGLYSLVVVRMDSGLSLLGLCPPLAMLGTAALAVSIALGWYIPAYQIGGDQFLNVALLRENVGRVVDVEGIDPGHRKPFFYGFVYLLQVFLPWSVFVPFNIVQLKQGWSTFPAAKRRALIASMLWVALFLTAVTISSSKRTVYLLPILPALAFLFSTAVIESTRTPSRRLVFAILVMCVGVLLGVGSIGLLSSSIRELIIGHINVRYADSISRVPALIGESKLVFYGLLSAIFLLLSSAVDFLNSRTVRGVVLLSCGWAAVALTANYTVMPALERFNSPQPFSEQMSKAIPPEAPLYYYQDDFFSVLYYMHRNIPLLSDIKELAPARPAYVLMRRDNVSSFLALQPESRLLIESEESAFYGKDKLAVVAIGATEKNAALTAQTLQ